MRLLIISNLFPPEIVGGYEILCEQVVKELLARRYDVSVLTSGEGKSDLRDGISIHRNLRLTAPMSDRAPESRYASAVRRTAAHNYRETRKTIQEAAPDIIFIWSQLRMTPAATRAAYDSGCPFALTFNDEHPAGFLPPKSPLKRMFWSISRIAYPNSDWRSIPLDHTTCISKTLKRNLIASGLPIESSKVIFQGVPLDAFPARESVGGIGSPVRIFYAGQLHPYKGVHTVIYALANLINDGYDVQLDIAGAGPDDYVRTLNDYAQNKKVSDRVSFLGKLPQDKLAAEYRAHDLFVFPSIWEEPFGLTHLEAMASGLPVVCSDRGGPAEFIRDGENGLKFPAEDDRALSDALAKLIQDENLRQRIALGGMNTARNDFSMRRYVDDLENWLIGILRNVREDVA